MKVPISKLVPNKENPRNIKDDAFKKLVQSLKDFPEMAEVREIVVNKDYVILGGNMRYKAMIAAGWKEADIKIVDWSEAKQKEFMVKDNVSGGEWDWDIIANEWDLEAIDSWGLELPSYLETEGIVDHFRDQDPDSGLSDSDDYEGQNTNTLILVYSDGEYKEIIEKLKARVRPEVDTPSKIVLELLRENPLSD
jgi:hypothetical protein